MGRDEGKSDSVVKTSKRLPGGKKEVGGARETKPAEGEKTGFSIFPLTSLRGDAGR